MADDEASLSSRAEPREESPQEPGDPAEDAASTAFREAGRTVRDALRSWPATARLMVIVASGAALIAWFSGGSAGTEAAGCKIVHITAPDGRAGGANF
ncbi:hypothetical protein [Herbidospora mongoliensis]|uniref:hypothetical protein n=1 Tax=Herbidospora mongoliensis TaxID=688067 RepID=UPI00083203CB|nr:hypothetical protein [Herbidospora mongoliensis]